MIKKLIYIPTGLASFGVAAHLGVVLKENYLDLDTEQTLVLSAMTAACAIAGTACFKTAFRRKCECDCKCKKQ